MKKTPIIILCILCILAAAGVLGTAFLWTQYTSYTVEGVEDQLRLSTYNHYPTAMSLERDEIIELTDEVFKKDPEMKVLIDMMEGKYRAKSLPISDNIFVWLFNYGQGISEKRGQELLDTYGWTVHPDGTKRYLLYEGEYYLLIVLHLNLYPEVYAEPLPE